MICLLLFLLIFLDGLINVLMRLVGKREKGELGSFSYQLFGAILFIPFIKGFPSLSSVWIYPLASGLLYGIGTIFMLKAFSKGEVSLIAPIGNFSPVLTFFLAILLLKETLTFPKIMAIFLIFLGLSNLKKQKNILLSLKALFSDQACQFYFLFILFLSFARLIDKKSMVFFPITTYAFLEFLIPALVALIFIFLKRELKELKNFLGRKLAITVFTSAVVGLKYGLFLFLISKFELSRVGPLNSLSTLMALFLSSLILKEKVEKRWLGAALMVAGAIILAYKI